jgi:hypothetical protein
MKLNFNFNYYILSLSDFACATERPVAALRDFRSNFERENIREDDAR